MQKYFLLYIYIYGELFDFNSNQIALICYISFHFNDPFSRFISINRYVYIIVFINNRAISFRLYYRL